jgi:hypothetical protein
MTSNIGSIPLCKNLMPGWNNQEGRKKSTSVILQNSISLSNLSCNIDNSSGSSLVATAAAWQRQRRWWQRGISDNGGSLGVIRQWRWQRNYEIKNEAELMEENFGNKGEDDDTFRGRLA